MIRLFDEKRADRIAGFIIRAGGIMVILVVVAIVANVGLEALPLFRPAAAGPVERVMDGDHVLVSGSDARRELVWALHRDGRVTFGGVTEHDPVTATAGPLVAADHEIHGLVSTIDRDGSLALGRLRFRDRWTAGVRTTSARWNPAAQQASFGAHQPWVGVTANGDGGGNLLAAAWDSTGAWSATSWDGDDETWRQLAVPGIDSGVRRIAVAEGLRAVAAVAGDGNLEVFRLPGMTRLAAEGVPGPVATARFLIGGGTLVAGGRDGSLWVLLEVPRIEVTNRGERRLDISGRIVEPGQAVVVADDQVGHRMASRTDVVLRPAEPVWRVVRSLPPVPSEPLWLAPAHRRRGFLVGTGDGTVALYHSTSGRRLVIDRWADRAVDSLALAPKGDGAVAVIDGSVLRRAIDNPHPEISLRTLFLPVFYEGYARPEWVWQTTGGSDAFEPKMSLWPLIFGTLKATLYAMLLSVPLALMAAVYVSQLAPTWLQSMVKPTVELMAAVPSVVVGFLAALWLAPRLEAALPAVLIGAVALPLAVVTALGVWRALPGRLRRRLPDGVELALLALVGGALLVVAGVVAGPIESLLFDGDLQRYLFTEWGVRYDQRNSIVVGLALGFAVIPVIFTIAEDACSGVPKSLVTASRALGATRWQTALRLVVPAASPGLFAAIMLGLGRAVGETMIVLMAAGNTPLLDLSPLNGMRTMSAAIAVEIPEAPVDGTLFRVLFLTGTLLFLFTLVVTTAADLVGSYLRRRYGRF